MKISKNTHWLLLLLLIFTGQTLAAPLANLNDCEMDHSTSISSDNSMSGHDMDSMSGHDMSNMDMSSGKIMDCCADDCQCSDGMCVSNVYFTLLEDNMSIFIQSNAIFQVTSFKAIQRSSSIYRPPILS